MEVRELCYSCAGGPCHTHALTWGVSEYPHGRSMDIHYCNYLYNYIHHFAMIEIKFYSINTEQMHYYNDTVTINNEFTISQ